MLQASALQAQLHQAQGDVATAWAEATEARSISRAALQECAALAVQRDTVVGGGCTNSHQDDSTAALLCASPINAWQPVLDYVETSFGQSSDAFRGCSKVRDGVFQHGKPGI